MGNKLDKKVFSIRAKDIEEMHLSFETTGKESAVWNYIGEAETVQKNSQRQELYNLLVEEDRPMTVKEIKSRVSDMGLSISQNSVQVILRKMVGEGQLEQPGFGKYAIPGQSGKIVNINVKRKMKRTH
jgi:predicted DNA-binding transcriptional regulator